ncbi:MAG: hypothetical protein ABSH28_08575 [Acidobacteriota bacterium]
MAGKRKATSHKVIVYADRSSGKVIPGSVFAYPGDEIVFEAIGTDVLVLLPKISHFERISFIKGLMDKQVGAGAIKIREGKPTLFEISLNAKPGRYPYAVYCEKIRAFAVGNSDPTIIIRKRTDDGEDEEEPVNP